MGTPARRHSKPSASFGWLNATRPGRYSLVRSVGEHKGDPTVCYTFGLHKSGLQEFVVSGKRKDLAAEMIRLAIEAARAHPGRHLPPGVLVPMPDGITLKARAVTEDEAWSLLYDIHASEVMPTEENARVIQLLWPDKMGRFPGEGASRACANRQRLGM